MDHKIEEEKAYLDFLGERIYMSISERKNPILMMFLLILENEELKHGNGVFMLKRAKDIYKIKIDNELEQQIKPILVKNTKRSYNELDK